VSFLDEFFDGEFFRRLGARERRKPGGKSRGAPPSRRLEKLGFAIEPALARLLDFVDRHDTNEIGPLGLFEIDDVLAGAGNALAFMLEQPFRVDATLLHAFPLGTTGAGDLWLVSLAPHRGRHEVFLFGHDTGTIELAADSLQAFALAVCLSDGETKATAAERRALVGHVRTSDDLDLPWLEAKPPGKAASPAPRLQGRTRDLRSTLNGYGRHEPAAAEKLPAQPLPAEVQDALLRAYLRGEDAVLGPLLQRFARSPAALVRDTVSYLARLVDEGGATTFKQRTARLLGPANAAAKAALKKRMAAQRVAEKKQRAAERAAEAAASKARELQADGAHRRAVDAFRKALTLTPNDGELWAAMCFSLWSLERWAEMRDAGEQAVRLDPESSYAYQQLACAYAGLEDDARTIQAGRRAVELNPKNAYAMYTVATTLLMNKDPEGRSLLDRACKLDKTLRADAKADGDIQKALAALD